MTADQLRPLTPAFVRTTRQNLRFVVVTATVVFAVTSGWLLRLHAQTSALHQAHLCTVILNRDDPWSLQSGAERLLRDYDRVLAIGIVESDGRVLGPYPKLESVERAIMQNMGISVDSPTRTHITLDDRRHRAWSVRVPLVNQDAETGRTAFIILARDSILGSLALSTAFVGLFIWFSTNLCLRWITEWFERRVTDPLRDLAFMAEEGISGPQRIVGLRAGGWLETKRIADQLGDLDRQVAEAKERTVRLEHTAEALLQRCENAFHGRLRRANDRATVDTLTGLRNRRFLQEELEPMFEYQKRRKKDFSVVMLDLDNFKHRNDTYGHKAGDELLHFTGDLLRTTLRPDDRAVRYGGDEFVLLLPDTNAREAHCAIQRVIKLFGQYSSKHCEQAPVTMSAGVAALSCFDGCQNGEQLIHEADRALYEVKSHGKNGVAIAKPNKPTARSEPSPARHQPAAQRPLEAGGQDR